ncbi:MAG: FixH family protein [Myxococcales bacterium]|nr:FixH family protein [Myxococcales bacterium]
MLERFVAAALIVAAMLAGCGDEVVTTEGLSEADRKSLDQIATDVDSLKDEVDDLRSDATSDKGDSDGFTASDRDALTGLAKSVDTAGTGGADDEGFQADDRKKLDEIVDLVTPAGAKEAPDLSEACDPVSGGLEVLGEDEKFLVRLVSSAPAVHATGVYEWAVQVFDPDYKAVPGAEVRVEPWMVAHDHGTDAVQVVDANSSGVYTLSGMNLFMDGRWEVRIDIKDGDTEDQVKINACLAESPTPEAYSGRAVYVFSTDGDDSYVTVIDADTMEVAKEIKLEGASWSDALPSPDGSRVFVNDSSNDQVHVFDTATQHKVASLDVGGRPIHLFNPNHGNEMWTHADAMGAFFVIDTETLAVQGPVTAALGQTGHGKLLYDPMVAPKAYATNVADPAAFPVDLDHKTVGYAIKLCESDAPLPCAGVSDCNDSGETCEGEPSVCSASTHKVGGTHDKAISPYNGHAYFQCSGGTRGYAVVDMATDSVVSDYDDSALIGSAAQSVDHRYLFLMDGDDVHVLDTMNDTDVTDATTPDVTFTMGGSPSARGTHSWVPGGNYNDMKVVVPQSHGTEVWILNMPMIGMIDEMPDHARTIVDVGPLTPPVGASHFSRRGVIAANHYFTTSDAGVVPVNLADGTAGPAIAVKGVVSRFTFADNSGGIDTQGGDSGGDHSQH